MESRLTKYLILIALLFFCIPALHAQLFMNKNNIIQEYGNEYEAGTANDSTEYIIYKRDYHTRASGKFIQRKEIYFKEDIDGTKFCCSWKALSPASETTGNVLYLKNEGFAKVGAMQWKDYRYNVVYEVSVKDGLCIITAFFDTKK